MEDELFEKLDELNINEIDLLLDKNINLSLSYSARKRIEQSVKKKTGYYGNNNLFKNKINTILNSVFLKRKIALALSVATVLSLGGGVYAYAKTPVAYVSLDINPSVELGVNAFNTVLSAEAYNEDGEKVLKGTNLINTKVDDAVSAVITNAISDGYIKEDNNGTTSADDATEIMSAVEITVSTDKAGVADKLDESIKEAVNETLKDNDVEAEVEIDKVGLAMRDEARKLGLTPGKLDLIQKLQELDPTIKVEDYRNRSVKDIQGRTKELRKINKTDETINNDVSTMVDKATDISINTTKNANDAGTNSDINTNSEVTTKNNDQQESILSKSLINFGNNKGNNGGIKKEENGNSDVMKQESNEKKDEKTPITSKKKSNNSQQGKSNSSNSEKGSNSNSNSQGKGKNN